MSDAHQERHAQAEDGRTSDGRPRRTRKRWVLRHVDDEAAIEPSRDDNSADDRRKDGEYEDRVARCGATVLTGEEAESEQTDSGETKADAPVQADPDFLGACLTSGDVG